MRIYNDLKFKSKSSVVLPDLEDLTVEQREKIIHKEWT